MSEKIYVEPGLSEKVGFQTDDKENRDADIYINDVRIYENCGPEKSIPRKSQDNATGSQQQTTSVNVSSAERNPLKAPAVFLGLLCFVLLIAVVVLVVLLIQDKNNWNMERKQLLMDNAKLKTITIILTNERDELQKQIETTRCPAKWMKFGNSCYLFSTSTKNWYDSRKFCESQDAHLVIISSIEEQEFVSSFLRRIWIGLTNERKEGEWMWVDGTAVNTTYWMAKWSNGKQKENCAVISHYLDKNDWNNWDDLSCTVLSYIMCEKILS